MTRCKFRCNSITETESCRHVKNTDGTESLQSFPLYTVKMSPVYSSDPNSENRKFWEASPSGSFELGCIYPNLFKVGQEYYLDITPAE